ncbi:MAG: hypothetical protein AAGD07_04575 [Planctomycetota bacterium]
MKLASNLGANTPESDFAGILLIQTRKTDSDEFIECHIYGKLTISNIESFRAKKPTRKADQVLAAHIRRKLHELDVIEEPL